MRPSCRDRRGGISGEFDGKRVSGTFFTEQGSCKNPHIKRKARLD